MKESGTFNWTTPNTGADNSSGFAGLPGGSRASFGAFVDVGIVGYWWSSTESSTPPPAAWFRTLFYFDGSLGRNLSFKQDGFSVRCLRD